MHAATSLTVPLKLLNYTFLNPLKQNFRTKLAACVLFLCYCCLVLEYVLQFIFNWKGLLSLDEITGLAGVYQIVCKTYTLIFKRNAFVSLLRTNVEQFWIPVNIPQKYRKQIFAIGNVVQNLAQIFGLGVVVTMTFFFLKPFFSNTTTRTLPSDTYHPVNRESSPAYELMYAYQVILPSIGCFGIVGFDTLFFALIANCVCQLKIVKGKLEMMEMDLDVEKSDEQTERELKKLIQHHCLILKCVKDLNRIYSTSLLHQFGSSILGICVCLVSIIASGFPPSLEKLFKYGTSLASLFVQLFMYCAAGMLLTEECESLSKTAYEVNWWRGRQPKLQKCCILIIQRANKKDTLAAGGMFVLNLENFTKILRTSLSFFTVVQATFSRYD